MLVVSPMSLNEKEVKVLTEEIYTSYGDLDEIIKERKQNKELQKKVDDFLGDHPLRYATDNYKAVLSRTIFTPNLELEYFLDVIKDFNLDPSLLEYGGKFVAKNIEKYHLCKLFFFEHIGKKGGILYESLKIVDFNKNEGKPMSDIETIGGEKLIDFHHKLLEYKYPTLTQNIIIFSEWFNKTRFLTEYYYFYFFSLFISHGVLFENFLMNDKEESKFIKDNVFLSFKRVEEYFGVKPIIVPLLPFESEKYRTWVSYRSNLEPVAKNIMYNNVGNIEA